MFNSNFYPTPLPVIEQMCAGIDFVNKHVLEPSAGKGDIVEYCRNLGAKVIACELDANLSIIASRKADRFLKYDFLKVRSEEVSHVNYIIMNPPFDADEKHILHAWQIAPAGCEIIALCNSNTVTNLGYEARRVLKEIINKNGSNTYLGQCFTTAERKTEVEVQLVKLYKPGTGEQEFEGYFDTTEEVEQQENGIMSYNEVRNIVNRYVAAVKMFNEVYEASDKMNKLIAPINRSGGIHFGAKQSRSNNMYDITRDEFKKELCKSAWRSIFAKMDMHKYVTRNLMDEINKFVEIQTTVPFTMTNIYKMIEVIIGTHGSRMDRVLTEAFDRICRLSKDNSEAGEKWATNSNYKINQRFIDTWICEHDTRWPSDFVKIRCGASDTTQDDLIKALCYISGKDYDQIAKIEYDDYKGDICKTTNTLYNFFHQKKVPWGQWVNWNEFLRVRGYKKGTMHFEFLSEKLWMDFNLRVAKIKGWAIPEKTNSKTKGTEHSK